ncbi:MAG: hypothetical protein IJD31_09920 [Lachnospiraceae bacterium]|nr:hypothetical protein [Lachnospiraceae bacterium]
MYNVSKKTNNQQLQTAYALYMIMGSYFHKSVCNTKVLERKLFLYYKDLPVKKQESLEEQAILRIEKILKDSLPALADLNCEVTISFKNGDCHLAFCTGFESVAVVVDCDGKYRICEFSEAGNERVTA